MHLKKSENLNSVNCKVIFFFLAAFYELNMFDGYSLMYILIT